MKSYRKKILLALGSLASITAVTFAIACGSSTSGSNEPSKPNDGTTPKEPGSPGGGTIAKGDKVSQGIWTSISQTALATNAWSFDRSTFFGSVAEGTDASAFVATQAQFIRSYSRGEPKLSQNAQGEVAYTAWTHESWKFEYASAVIVTSKNDEVKTFDSDAAEILPKGTASSPIVIATSNNARSINSSAFREALRDAKRLQLRIKSGYFYSDSQGRKTNYEIKAEDFWVSYKRSNLLTTSVRHASGGSEALDTLGTKLNPARNLFSKDSRYSNGYLYGLFGVDVERLLDESTALLADQQNPGKKLITWDGFEGGTQFDFLGMFSKQLVETTEFSPVSEAYIQTINAKPKHQAFSAATGEARRFGAYTYGRDWEDILYPGYFYIKEVNNQQKIVRYAFNENYVDAAEIKKNDGYVRSLDQLSLASGADERLVAEFKLGNLYAIPRRGNLVDNQRKLLDDFLTQEKNRRFALSFSRTRLAQGAYVLTHPSPRKKDGEGAEDYLFNDNLARLVYGQDRATLAQGGDAMTTNFFSPKSIAFRAAIFAGINWQQVARQINDNLSAYLGHIPPDASIGGSDELTAGFNTIREKTDEINTRNVLVYDPTNKKITSRNVALTSNDEANQAIIRENFANVSEQYKSAAFALAQAEITKILDAEGIGSNDKVTWIWIAPSREKPNAREEVAIDNLVKTLNALDSKGRLEISFEVKENQSDFDAAARNGIGYTVRGGWSNDYDGIGTGLDGIAHRERSNMMPFFSRALNPSGENAWISTIYPQITALASSFDTFIKGLNRNLTAPQTKTILIDNAKPVMELKDWVNVSNEAWADGVNAVINADQFSLMGAFFAFYQRQRTNQQLVDLTREMNEVIGFTPGRREGASILPTLKPILQAVNKGRILPVSTTGVLYIQDLVPVK